MIRRRFCPGLPGKLLRTAALSLPCLTLVTLTGCLDRPIGVFEPHQSWSIVERLDQSRVDKIDLLLAIDNSRSMADKQAILAQAVPDLVESLLNPPCVDAQGNPMPEAMQPKGPMEVCPSGTARDFEPVLDVHIGIISSSLGGHGADLCADQNERAHLISRKDPSQSAEQIPTYANKGFLAWDPAQTKNPKGEANLGSLEPGAEGLIPTLAEMVVGVGQVGCGFESQLESIYRFLVDPEPYETIDAKTGTIQTSGKDQTLLQQRRDFLRPDSLVAIVMLTDENDCSINETGSYFLAAGSAHLTKPRAICEDKPNDPCCVPCDVQAPAECGADATCFDDQGKVLKLGKDDDNINLRCFDQKRRFGRDFLYPTDRYVNAFSKTTIATRNGSLVENPLFISTNPETGAKQARPERLVFFAGLVGVPFQDIARNPNDLKEGLKTAKQIAKDGTWDLILGNPAENILPEDPLMHESPTPRGGIQPITEEPLDNTPETPNENSINGHEWKTQGRDLQYACIFDVPTTTDCADDPSCECFDSAAQNPLCDANNPHNRIRAKAQPGIRHLQVMQGLGEQAIVASVCPSQITNASAPDYGYRPAIGAIVDQLKLALGGQCLPRKLDITDEGQARCLVIEAKHAGNACSCNEEDGRLPLDPAHQGAIQIASAQAGSEAWDCFCEIPQLKGEALEACQTIPGKNPQTQDGKPADGFCYVDATTEPPIGNPTLVDRCPSNEQRMLRLVGKGEPSLGSTVLFACTSE